MPAFNAGQFISEAIKSVLAQTFENFELMVVNDGSTDNTAEIVESFSDKRVKLINQPNTGIAGALNSGLTHAAADIIARFDADDVCMPERLEKQYAFLKQNREYIAVGSDAEYTDAEGRHLFNFNCIGHTHEEIEKKILVYCPFIHSGVMYRKDAVKITGGYNEHAHTFEDYLLWVRLIKQGKFHNINERLLKVRFHPASVTIDEKWRGKKFRQLKKTVLFNGSITKDEGDKIAAIINAQDTQKMKYGSYFALCGKKLLLDSHRPAHARKYFKKVIAIFPLKPAAYVLYLLSFFPKKIIQWLHAKSPTTI